MQKHTKIAVIGGTGKSGKYLVRELIKQGYFIKLLLRPSTNRTDTPKHPLIEIIEGNANDYQSISTLIDGCEAVISTLGMGIPASEKTIFSQSTTNIIRAMNEHQIRRYVVITGLNVDTIWDKKSDKNLMATRWMYENFPISTADKQTEYALLIANNIDWTLVRLPLIEQTDEQRQTQTSLEDCEGDKVSATDLAHFLIEQLTDKTFIRQAPFLWSL
ncbi:NADH-flavin reductase [Emticicia aquatilis]|uniref:NADH-flavin reductase n=1 Tax=Emticicia aquatilis TaxID=1537369 RepID=A0A916YQ72_9BACT|nr:NAD(P)H-binding protein [Emticicia aquatilis]GGD54746.1 NADH-flavin reductase [Emticicia aquatilis]